MSHVHLHLTPQDFCFLTEVLHAQRSSYLRLSEHRPSPATDLHLHHLDSLLSLFSLIPLPTIHSTPQGAPACPTPLFPAPSSAPTISPSANTSPSSTLFPPELPTHLPPPPPPNPSPSPLLPSRQPTP